jgi:Ca2+-binding RTX toxin-like protein
MSIEGLTGTSGDDKIGGTSGADRIVGFGGNDTLYGGAGNDVYEFDLTSGTDTIIDAPYVSEDIIDASGAFNSSLFTATWVDLGFGSTPEGNRYRYRLVITRNGTGEEVYRSQDAVDFLYTSAQSQMPSPASWPYSGGQWLNGAGRTGNGDQTTREILQTGNGGVDAIRLGAGIGLTDLTFTRLNSGADLQIAWQSGNSVTITGQNDANRAIEQLQLDDGLVADLTTLRVLGESATAQTDFMVGNASANTLEGLAGDDILSGLAGNDTLRGGDGNDSIEGGLGSDSIDGGNDSVSIASDPATVSPTLPYGDTARYVRSNAAVTVNLETGQTIGGHAQGDTIVRVGGVSTIENLVGSLQFNDKLTGDSRSNRLYGLGGNDILEGRAGNDLLVGGLGDDTLRGGDGEDVLSGDEGDDLVRGENGNDILTGGAGMDEMSGDGGNDVMSGGDDDDFISGDLGSDILNGDAGADQLSGGDDVDQLSGGDGDDTLYGGDGNDTLTGGAGTDWLDGETGDDTFVFDANSGSDTFSDVSGTNRIVINGVAPDHIWLTRVGDDLRIGVIGGTTDITVLGYYLPDSSLVREIALDDHSLFLVIAQPLIDAMTLLSPSAPTTMPSTVGSTLINYWFEGHGTAPVAANQTLTTNEDTPLTGSVGARDPDGNIVSYSVVSGPTLGALIFNSATGAWTYNPGANLHGADSFQVLVTDADSQSVVQTVSIDLVSVNDAPTVPVLTGAPASITERDHPISGTSMAAIVLGTLSSTDGDVGEPGDFGNLVYSVNDSRFEVVNGNTLQLKAGAALDYEAGSTVSIAVTVRDRNGAAGGLSATQTFTFNVIDSDDYFYGTNGNDTVTGVSGNDRLLGLDGNDVLIGGAGADHFLGGAGIDSVSYETSTTGITLNLATGIGTGDAAGDVFDDVMEGVIGSNFADTLTGSTGADILDGRGGNDSLSGGAGDDTIEGGLGNDTIDGGSDSVSGASNPATVDPLQPFGDTARYASSNAAVTINLETGQSTGGHAQGDTIVRVGSVATIENLSGSSFNDVLTGDSRSNRLYGQGGNDTLDGRAGNDLLVGGLGNDTLRGGDGDDVLSGEGGDDTLRGDNGSDTLTGGAGFDDMSGDAGNDVLNGGDDDDFISGDLGNDILNGDAGSDQLSGGDDNDQLSGGTGDDYLYGGDGTDTLTGGTGDDWLDGESGDDTFVFDAASGSDTIFDAAGANKVVINGVAENQIWLTRSGDDLRIGVIGGTTTITVLGYYLPDYALLDEIDLSSSALVLANSQPLIDAMTLASADTPASMPSGISSTLGTYWTTNGPVVSNQTLATNEDTTLSGSVNATDRDNNIVSYAVQTPAGRGSVNLNAATGAWVYTPTPNLYGTDTFQIIVTDAQNLTAVQTVTVNVASVNDGPTNITLTGAPAGIAERDHPVSGSALDPIVLGTLSAADVDAPDAGDFATHLFSVSDSRFEVVNGNTLRLKAGVALDFEAGTTVSVDVTVRDRNGAPQGLTFTRTFTFNVLDGDDYFYGTAGNDTLTGQAGRNLIYGQGGDDTLTGANVVDTLDGGDGADQLFGLGGDDTLDGGALNDRLEGGAGSDQLIGGTGNDVLIGGTGADHFLGGSGTDTVSYETATAGVTVNLATGTGTAGDAAGDVFDDTPEILVGSTFNDTLTGSAGADTIEGRTGDDIINGGAGTDTLRGGEGSDTLDAGTGNDVLDGGAGNDILIGGIDGNHFLIDVNSATDEVRNFDTNGADIDVLDYQDITNNRLWFHRSGNDLVVTVIGQNVFTTVKDWYLASLTDRANFKVDFTLSGNHLTRTIDAEALVNLMAGYGRPTDQAGFDLIHANPAFEEAWRAAWRVNVAPSVSDVSSQIVNEDGTFTTTITVTDDFTPQAGLTVTAQSNNSTLVNTPTLSAPNAQGDRTLTVTTKPNASGGPVTITITATDGGGAVTTKTFQLTLTPVADAPTVTQSVSLAPSAPATKPTLALGSLGIDIQTALADTDGSETLNAVQISGVPSGLSFNAGTNLGSGVWSFTPAQLAGLRIQGPTNWSQNVQLSVTATSRETVNGNVSSASATRALNIDFNAAPSDIQPGTLSVNENVGAGTTVGTFTRTDADASEAGGDAATYSLSSNPGNLFSISAGGTLTTNSVFNREAQSSYNITVRVTDSGGLSYDEAFAVSINDLNEAPSLNSSYSYNILENYSPGTVFGTVAASDPDSTASFRDFRYELVGAPSTFAINSTNGQISTQSGLFGGATSYNFSVRVWDGGAIGAGNAATASVGISVQDVDRAPTISTPTFSIGENSGSGAFVGTISGSDPDGTLAYQLLGGGGSDSGNPGALTLNSAGQIFTATNLNYEARSSYDISVRTWDGGIVGAGHAVDTSIHVNVNNVNEAPTMTFSPRTDGVMSTYVGHASAVDPEGSGVTYQLVQMYQEIYVTTNYGAAWTDSYQPGGAYITSSGDLYCPTDFYTYYDLQYPFEYWYNFQDYILTIAATDSSGQYSNGIVVRFRGTIAMIAPIVLDLDKDGFDLVSVRDSQVQYAMSEDAMTIRTGWVGAKDALLALDRNGDGTISGRSEISFVGDVPNATSDLEGLAAFDSNQNGSLDAADARFAEFRVWQDLNQDGVSQANELRSLADAGIDAIGLTRTPTGVSPDGATDNVITATAEIIRSDGTKSVAGDATFAYMEGRVTVVDNVPLPTAPTEPIAMAPTDSTAQPMPEVPAAPALDATATPTAPEAPVPPTATEPTVAKGASPSATSGVPTVAATPASPSPMPEEPTFARSSNPEVPAAPERSPAADETPAPHNSRGSAPPTERWEYQGLQSAGALHTSLDSVARRRLQMIDAMASFADESSAMLELQPHRHVNAHTLELLTAVAGVRTAA